MSTTILTPYNGITYGGNLAIQEIPGATIRKNEFDIDIMVRKYRGHSDYLPAFLLANPKYSADYQYPAMARTEYVITMLDGSLVDLQLTYKGILDGNPPTPIISNDSCLTSVKVTTNVPADGDVTLQYYADTTIYRYILGSYVGGPIYTGIRGTSLDYTIVSMDPAPDSLSGTVQKEFDDVVTRFSCEQQGLWFTYEVQVQRQIRPLNYLALAQ